MISGQSVATEQQRLVGIEPFCGGSTFIKNDFKNNSITKIEVTLNKPKKWTINALNILISNTELIWEKYKKKYSGFIHVYYTDKHKCIFPAKIRQSGDWKDHITLNNGNIKQSLDVKLKKGNVLGLVKFKLLIPESRAAENEVVFTTLLRELGYLAPRTRFFNLKLMGNNYKTLLQESTRKELLESLKLREGPILEGDERFSWGDGSNNIEKFNDKLTFARLINNKWAKRGATSFKISELAVTQLNSAYLDYLVLRHGTTKWSNYNHVYLDNSKLSNKSKKHIQYLDSYDSILTAAGATHALLPHNRKFYYDPMNKQFFPIYYDGNVKFPSPFHHGFGVSPSAVNGAKFALSMLKKVTIEKLGILLEQQGLALSNKKLQNILHVLEKNLELLTTYKTENFKIIRNLKFYIKSVADEFPGVMFVHYSYSTKQLLMCNPKFENCEVLDLSIDEYSDLLSGKYKKSGVSAVVYLGSINTNLFDVYKKDTALSNSLQYLNLPGNVKLTTSAGMKVNYDTKTRALIINQNAQNGWALLSGGEINNMSVIFKGANTTTNNGNNKQRYNDYLLTGCLTIVDSKMTDTSIKVSNTSCEDGLNLIRVTGNINKLVISNTASDALDMDFSNIRVASVRINNAGNDCVDVSGGIYKMDKIIVSSCTDKGISIGEDSKFNASTVDISSSNIGVSVKDSSIAEISSLKVTESHICLTASRKKQEFMGAIARVEYLQCPNGKYFSDPGSQVTIGNTH